MIGKIYDLIIIGAGPAGLSCAVTAGSEGLSVLLLCADEECGGQSRFSSAIENYLGFPEGITGRELADRSERQARKFGVEIQVGKRVNLCHREGEEKCVEVEGGGNFKGKCLVIACGLKWRELEGEVIEERREDIIYGGDMRVSSRYKGREVLILGGGNSAGQAALHWGRETKVKIVARRGLENTMSSYLIERIRERGIEVMEGEELKEMREGGICVLKEGEVPCDKVIPFIGVQPCSDFVGDICGRDEAGYLTEGTCDGVFVVGDCRAGSVKRIAVAVGEGAEVVSRAHRYLSLKGGK